jgi:membrane protease YdiL (CAAX protease family)
MPAVWSPGSVPWGLSWAPPVLPVLEPPGRFHPPKPGRRLVSLSWRASPRLFLLGLLLGVPGFLGMALFEIGLRVGLEFEGMPLRPWQILEILSLIAAFGLTAACLAQARQRRADGWKDYTGPAPLLVTAALLAVINLVTLTLRHGLLQVGIELEGATETLLLVLAYLAIYTSLVHFLAVRTGGLTWRDIVRPRRAAQSTDDWSAVAPEPIPVDAWGRPQPSWQSRISGGPIGDILWALAMVLPLVLVSMVASALLSVVLGLGPSDMESPVPTVITDLDRWVSILAIAVIVPLGEEIFFRGFATNAWGRSLDRNSAILRGALLFAAIHIMNVATTDAGVSARAAILNMGARVPVAIALTWLYMRRRSLLAPGVLHGSYNGLIVLITILASS